MSREILFRGKREDNREWVYGGWFKVDNENYIITNCDNIPIFDLWNFAEYVIPETVGQFTGLTDKNGKKIFEHDIVNVTYREKRQYKGVPYDDEYCFTEEVFYSEENACFVLKVMCDDIPMYRPLHNFKSFVKIKEIEVIGNRWDNPELLEVE